MFIGTNEWEDSVFRLLEQGRLIVSVGFLERNSIWDLTLWHILIGKSIEVVGIVVHFWREFVSQSNKFEYLTAAHASLERSFSKHDPHELVSFVVIFVGGSAATDKPEGSISSKDYCWVIDGSEVGKLHTFEIVISLEIEWISTEVSLPLGWNLIETLSCKVELGAVLETAGLKNSLQMFFWGSDCFFYVSESVKYVEA